MVSGRRADPLIEAMGEVIGQASGPALGVKAAVDEARIASEAKFEALEMRGQVRAGDAG